MIVSIYFCILISIHYDTFKDQKKETKRSILKRIKYEYETRDKISSDILIDSLATKEICEKLCLHPTVDG